jgi:hypothetical protein
MYPILAARKTGDERRRRILLSRVEAAEAESSASVSGVMGDWVGCDLDGLGFF